jgi:SPASM domain peptide maturase of grasp-with-spasm system
VQGASRSTVCDLQRQRYVLIPNGLYTILKKHADSTLPEIKASFDNEYDDVIDDYFEFLESEGLGFWCTEPESFPDMSLEWDRPEKITNAIIDADATSTHDYGRIFEQLDDLFCKTVQIRFYDVVSPGDLTDTLSLAQDTRLRSIEVLMPAEGWTLPRLATLSEDIPRLGRVFLTEAEENKSVTLQPQETHLIWSETVVDSADCCGKIHPEYFVSHMETFTEAQQHNTCLNRKISIDVDGEVRNCPAFPVSYGNVSEISLHSVVARREFRELWEINKDQIDVCRDCEFRYVCTDCRAFISEPNDLYSKPSKCSYDPYTATWGGEGVNEDVPQGATEAKPA